MRKFEFDVTRHDLAGAMSNIFDGQELCQLHELLNVTIPCVDFAGDQKLIYHRVAYANLKWEFLPLFKQFVLDVIRPRFSEPIIYQKVPTLRFQLPKNKGVGAFHRDADYGHSPDEINFYVPLTEARGTNTIWTESKPGEKDWSPFEPMQYGEIMEWDGANLAHGNCTNTTGKTRVSIDLRVMPLRLYDEADGARRRTAHLGKRFVVGEYFAICED